MGQPIFIGSGVALITPFDEHGVNLKTLRELVEFHIENHTDALIVCGTTGEPSTMNAEEKRTAIAAAVDQAKGRVPVIAGTGGNCTAHVIEDSRRAQGLGADALLVVTPYYNKCTQDGLVAHYTAVADAVSLPIIVYNVPARTGLNIQPATMARLAEHPNIAALKDATADITQIVETARLCAGLDLELYSGNDDHILPLLSLGAKGVISVLANVAPRQTHDLVAAYMDGDIARSRGLQFSLNPLVQALFCEISPIPVKYGVGLLGFDAGGVRLPLTTLTEPNQARLRREMATLGLLTIQ